MDEDGRYESHNNINVIFDKLPAKDNALDQNFNWIGNVTSKKKVQKWNWEW